ncbi:MAG TPA: hypothetical protein VGE01_01540, partial [Fimbriimonas sp.]
MPAPRPTYVYVPPAGLAGQPDPQPAQAAAPYETAPPRASSRSPMDLEYQLGAKIGPVVGAVACVAALFYLVSLGLTRGWITPAMLFSGVCLICFSFIGVGLWKRNEKEDFGQILTGIGSCGLYLNFAAGNVFQHLYGEEALVGLFFGLSLLNLGYAWWRSSQAFLGIGVIGGFLAALMPLRDELVTTNLILSFLIVLPAVAIAAKNRWLSIQAGLYVLSLLLLGPAASITGPGSIPVAAAFYLTALVNVLGYLWANQEWEYDPLRLLAPIGLFVGGALGFLMRYDEAGSFMVLAYGAVGALAAVGRRGLLDSQGLLAAGAVTALVFAPFGVEPFATMWIFIGLSIALALAAQRWLTRPMSALAQVALALGLWNFAYLMFEGSLNVNQESLALGAFILAVVAASWSIVKGWREFESVLLGASVVLMAPIIRIVELGIVSPAVNGTASLGVACGLLVCSFLLSALFLSVRSLKEVALPLAVTGGALLGYTFALVGRPPIPGAEVALAAGYALAVILLALATKRHLLEDAQSIVVTTATVVLGMLATRLGYLGLHHQGLSNMASLVLPASVYVLGSAVVGMRRAYTGVAIGSAVCWALTVAFLVAGGLEVRWESASILLLRASLVLLTARFYREPS